MKESEKVQPIRLNGRLALQFVDGFEPASSLLGASPTILNLDELLESRGFDEDERAFLNATRIEGLTFSRLHRLLGWNASKVDRIRKSVSAKLNGCIAAPEPPTIEMRHSGGNSIHLSYQQTVCTWSLTTLSPEVIAEELVRARSKSIQVSSLPESTSLGTRSGGRKRIMKMQLHEVQGKLRAERIKLSDVADKARGADDELFSAEKELAALQAASIRDEEDVLIVDGHQRDKSLQKRVADAEKRVAEVRRRTDAFTGAIQRQQAIVEELQGEIDNRKLEAFRLDFAKTKKECAALVVELAYKAAEVQQIAQRHQINGISLAWELFPPGETNTSERDSLITVVNAALKLEPILQWTRAGKVAA